MTVYIDRTQEPDDVFEREVLARVGDPVTAPQPAHDGEVCNDWCGPGSHHMTPCPAAPSEPLAKHCPVCAAQMDTKKAWWWTEKGATCSEPCAQELSEPPAETQQDDEPAWVESFYRWAKADKSPGSYSAAFAAGWAAARPSADTEALRDVLLKHHPIAHTLTGPLKGCRCGQVKIGQDVIAHVIGHVRAALDGEQRG